MDQPIKNNRKIGLYFHVPFCEQKCHYCNFAIDIRNRDYLYSRYIEALMIELQRQSWISNCEITGIDIGGGTPTRLPKNELIKLLMVLRPLKRLCSHPFPLSIETTPRIAALEPEKLLALKEFGVDRISVGIQSSNGKILRKVNRDGKQTLISDTAFQNICNFKFKRWNVDLIFGLPGQSIKAWKCDLNFVLSYRPDSITTYDCLYRGKSRIIAKCSNLPKPKEYGQMYDLGYDYLRSNGYYAPYGSVNFSRNRFESGVSAYFESRLLDGLPFLGLGNYASSLINQYWFFNIYSVNRYLELLQDREPLIDDCYYLPSEEWATKYVLWSLNFGTIDEKRFKGCTGLDFQKQYEEEIDFAVKKGLIIYKDGLFNISTGEFCQINRLRSLFYTHRARRWFLQNAGVI
ncbi:radical SAM protein [Desulfobacterales bacterium HSG2]|nr:radical SAM protein [Desulfobacterales bacterium HSG2]